MPTIKDVARLAGVSYTTVSHVINGTRPVAEDTRDRVEKAIKELGYRQNMIARGLRKGESMTIGVVSHSSSDAYFSEVLHGIQERAWESGYSVYISYTDITEACVACMEEGDFDFFERRERDILEGLINRNIQGLILNSIQNDQALTSFVSNTDLPCVLFQRHIPGKTHDIFKCKDAQGTQEAMNYLLSLGHRRIALMEGYGYESHSVKYRKEVWKHSLAKAGIDVDPDLLCDGRYDSTTAYELTSALLSMEDRPTAIIYYSDTMAMAGIRAATDMGIHIPAELSIIGYDNLLIDEVMIPRLTSVNQMSAHIGREMMERLIERIENPSLPQKIQEYPQNLVIRESTGAAPQEDNKK